MKNPYHHNSKRGIIWSLFYENRLRVEALNTDEVRLLMFLVYPNKTPSNYEIGSTLSRMKEFERVSPDGMTPARWWFKEEVV